MSTDPNFVRLTRLSAELRVDRSAMRARTAETRDLIERWEREGSLPRAELIVVAVNLHAWYTAAEVAYERVARLFDQSVPQGPGWHVEILSQMQIEIPGLRPAVLPAETRADMDELRKFRHFFRNAYVLDLHPERVKERALELLRVAARIEDGLEQLDQHLDRIRAELKPRP